jgi:hypothetical protein
VYAPMLASVSGGWEGFPAHPLIKPTILAMPALLP